MGGCFSAHAAKAASSCMRARASEPAEAVSPMPDTSGMDLEEIFRMGIAEAQRAASLQRRDRLAHIQTARELLKVAFQRCRPGVQGDDDIRTHLYAVLLKLGEDARALQNLHEERGDFHQLAEDTPVDCMDSSPENEVSAQAGRAIADDMASEDSSDIDSPRRRRWEYSKEKEFLLLEGSDDEGTGGCNSVASGSQALAVGAGSSASPVLAGEQPELIHSEGTNDADQATDANGAGPRDALLRSTPLTTVQECEDGGGSATDALSPLPAWGANRTKSKKGCLLAREEDQVPDRDREARLSTTSFGGLGAVVAGIVGSATSSPLQPSAVAANICQGAALVVNECKSEGSRVSCEEPASAEDRGGVAIVGAVASGASVGAADEQHTTHADALSGGATGGGSCCATPNPAHATPLNRVSGRKTPLEPSSPAVPTQASWTDEGIGPANIAWPPAANTTSAGGWPASTGATAGGGWPSPQWSSCSPQQQWPNVMPGSSLDWPAAPASVGHGAGTGIDGTDSKESQQLQRNLRAVQPQQFGSSHLGSKQRRRSAASMGGGVGGFASGGCSSSSSDVATAAVPQGTGMAALSNTPTVSRHTGRQPSQSSSSGSQGNVSDSDQSSIGNAKRSRAAFAPAIKEECASFAPPARGAATVADSTERPDTSAEERPGKAGHSRTASIGSGGGNFVRAGHSRTPSTQADVGTPDAAQWASSKLMTPAMDGATLAPLMEKATPSQDAALRNPLSQPEFLSENPSRMQSSRIPSGNNICAAESPGAQSRSSLDSLSLVGSCAPSAAPSPFCGGATPGVTPSGAHLRPGVLLTPPLSSAAPSSLSDWVSVRILNGVSGEEEVRFAVATQSSYSEQHFLTMLDSRCKQKTGHALADLNWLFKAEDEEGARYQRRKCDLSMVEELFEPSRNSKKGPTVLLLCTVPVRPPSELPAGKVRLKNLTPARVTCGQVEPVRVLLDTSPLDDEHEYAVAFTHQWSNQTYTVEATVLKNSKGVEVTLPRQMLSESANNNSDGLYDVHLIIDRSSRSENRRTLTVVSAESELSSSSTAQSMSGGFEAIGAEKT